MPPDPAFDLSQDIRQTVLNDMLALHTVGFASDTEVAQARALAAAPTRPAVECAALVPAMGMNDLPSDG